MRCYLTPSQLCKNLVTLFAIAVVFQLTRLLTDELDAETKTQQSSSLTASGSHKEYVRVMPGASSDKSGKYSIHRFYKAEGFGSHMKAKDITLVSHVTIDKMHLLFWARRLFFLLIIDKILIKPRAAIILTLNLCHAWFKNFRDQLFEPFERWKCPNGGTGRCQFHFSHLASTQVLLTMQLTDCAFAGQFSENS